MMETTYTIDEVIIGIIQPGSVEETFTLERPNIFEFGFEKDEILEDYPDGDNITQRGYRVYRFLAFYQYESHDMNLLNLLTARRIGLKFPPVFGDVSKYQTANVILDNDSVPENWLKGLVMDSDNFSIPSGSVTLRFKGETPYSEDQMNSFHWKQSGTNYIET